MEGLENDNKDKDKCMILPYPLYDNRYRMGQGFSNFTCNLKLKLKLQALRTSPAPCLGWPYSSFIKAIRFNPQFQIIIFKSWKKSRKLSLQEDFRSAWMIFVYQSPLYCNDKDFV